MKKRILVLAALVLSFLCIGGGVLWYHMTSGTTDQELLQFMKKAEEQEVDALFLATYPVENFDMDILQEYKGIKTELLPKALEDGTALFEVVEKILDKEQHLTTLFLGISPDKEDKSNDWEEALLELGKANPQITFEIMLAFPKISEWAAMETDKVQEQLDWYAYVCDLYSHYDKLENVHVFMPGCEEWLIWNESNYEENGGLTKEAALEFIKVVCCDYGCIVVPNTIQDKCTKLFGLVEAYQETDWEYGTKTDETYVFLGDSVIGNYTGSMSIPGVVSYMTGAETINCGYGGLAAASAVDAAGLADVVDCLLNRETDRSVEALENENVQQGILQFWEKDIASEEANLAFFLSFGINDYATGRPIYNAQMDEQCYIGAVANAVQRLQKAYPNAKIILMTPNFIELFDYGTKKNGTQGAVFQDYIDALKKFADENSLPVIDIYEKLGITKENMDIYLADGCHPNYYGRFKIGEIVWESMLLQ